MFDEDQDNVSEICNVTGMYVANCTTPANYFHALHRQVHCNFQKLLIVISPKNLLCLKCCIFVLEDVGPGSMFNHVYDKVKDTISNNAEDAKLLVFCTGQIYYELLREGKNPERNDIALVHLDQITPFAFNRVVSVCEKYSSSEVVWAQQ